MDLEKVLAQLHAELQNLDAAIESLERIQQGARRRGRPPEWLTKSRGSGVRGKRVDPEKGGTGHSRK
jgi:hypothetical protein